jgi:uncharacterized protein YqeY
MGLRDRITEDMKAAMRAKDAQRLGAIRLLLAAIKQREVDERVELDDAAVIAVVDKLSKQRRDSIEQFSRAAREDLAERERFELGVLAEYLPQQASEDEIAAVIDAAVAATGAAGPKDMGKVMGQVRGKLAGRADLARVSAAIRARLGA